MNRRELRVINGRVLFSSEWLSNWEIAPMTIDGKTFNCVEQWMMYKKAELFEDKASMKAIMKAEHPRDQKNLGRAVQGYDEQKWASARFDVVVAGTVEKYKQNPELKEKLLACGDVSFVEASPDKVWGSGLPRDSEDSAYPAKWRGQNLCGKAITKARDLLKADQQQSKE